MTLYLRHFVVALLGSSLVLAAAAPSFADDKITKATDPDPTTNPVLANIAKLGTKIYYLGMRGGLDGWLIAKNGQVQIAYALPGSQDLMVGALFGPSGENVSSAQVQSILDAHPDLKNAMVASANQPPGMTGTGAPNDAISNIAAATQAAKAQIARLAPNPPTGQQPAVPFVPATQTQPAAVAQVQQSPAAAFADMMPPGERLMKDLENAAGTNIGNTSAPLLIMVMDPTCPHCKNTWGMLRDKVLGNALQVRLIPIARNASDAEEERAAAQLLHSADTLNVLDRYEAGDKNQLAGVADPGFIQAVRANHQLIDSWHIDHTPFLVYRGKDGKVKIVQGEPEKPAALLADLLP